jgi:homoserine kinase type II
MAVFTVVTQAALESWLEDCHAGGLLGYEGIAAGIENTNYFVDTTRGRWVLTLFERMPLEQIDFCLRLTQRLAQAGLPCPGPQTRNDGRLQADLAGRPATLVARLPGQSVAQPNLAQCKALGAALAQLHQAAQDLEHPLPNPRGLAWCTSTAAILERHLTPSQAQLLADELATQQAFAAGPVHAGLPRGPVHADLFRDNALFEGDTLSGIFDFYFAGVDTWMFDLAVSCNDWCIHDEQGTFDAARLDALRAGYCSMRALSEAECQAWPFMLRAAALRFWISRLADWTLPRPAHVLAPKDPSHFERILTDRRATHRTL